MRNIKYNVIIEQDEDGIYFAEVPDLPGCFTQGETLDELEKNVKEAIELYLEIKKDIKPEKRFIAVQQVTV